MSTKISATIVADSIAPYGDRITTMMITFPRFILAELNTHRMLSKNSASSRAIPFKKMVEMVETNPFIPIAFQKEHKGMQGSEYITDEDQIKRIKAAHLNARDSALAWAEIQTELGVTKQLVNRYIEPFMWHTVLITGTHFENFFALRCPQYTLHEYNDFEEIVDTQVFRSKKQILELFPNWFIKKDENKRFGKFPKDLTELEWLLLNKGQAEIHMMALAEAMWDAMNESVPKPLLYGEWHIPFEDKINIDAVNNAIATLTLVEDNERIFYKDELEGIIKISTAMAARTSYTTVGDEKEISYEKLIGIHDRIVTANPMHASPMEHCARVMTVEEYYNHVKGVSNHSVEGRSIFSENDYGWCRNYRGFIQYRHILETQ